MVSFSAEAQGRLEALLPKYPERQAALLPALWIAQEEFGHLNADALRLVASFLALPPSHVYSVASFYSMYHLEPVGKYLIEICASMPCGLLGGEDLLAYALDKLGVHAGETTADGRFTVRRAECLAACGAGPCLQVNGDRLVEHLTRERLDAVLAELAGGQY